MRPVLIFPHLQSSFAVAACSLSLLESLHTGRSEASNDGDYSQMGQKRPPQKVDGSSAFFDESGSLCPIPYRCAQKRLRRVSTVIAIRLMVDWIQIRLRGRP